jgi:hypothetical protein
MRILISKDPRYPLDNKKIREKVEEILKQLGIKNVFEISLAFCMKKKALEIIILTAERIIFPKF